MYALHPVYIPGQINGPATLSGALELAAQGDNAAMGTDADVGALHLVGIQKGGLHLGGNPAVGYAQASI